MIQKRFSATLYLIVINVILFIVQSMTGGISGWFTQLFVLRNIESTLMAPYTLLTSMFLHADFGHIFFNMYVLLLFGSLIENLIGTKRFLIAYFGSGLIAALVSSMFMTAGTSALGASAAIMGITGITIILLPNLQILFFFIIPMSMRTAGIIIAAIDFFGMFNPNSTTGNFAHLLGLGAGMLFAMHIKKKSEKYKKKMNKVSKIPTYKLKSMNSDSYEKTIEMTDEDMDNYFKHGRI
jgi:membrane associated rhomboid family serine protease